MFRSLRVRKEPAQRAPEPPGSNLLALARDATFPIALRQLNLLPDVVRQRLYRGLLPPALLARFGIDPITGKDADGEPRVRVRTDLAAGAARVSVAASAEPHDDFIVIELEDNAFNGIDLHWLLLHDPDGERFGTDVDEGGAATLFGTARRNRAEEERALRAGLAPAQIRAGLGASSQVLQHIEAGLSVLGHTAYFAEPLTYASAWVFERRGFAYVRGHKLMDDIHREFQPGGRLHQALDDSTPFRHSGHWRAVRGRAWAIHDGVLGAIDQHWDGLRMVKQIGKHAGVETFPGAAY